MGNICKREIKLSRKELTIEKIEEEKEKARKRSFNRRHSTGDITIGPTPPLQMEQSNMMGSIMDTPFSASIHIISTNLTSNDASNPSFSTHRME